MRSRRSFKPMPRWNCGGRAPRRTRYAPCARVHVRYTGTDTALPCALPQTGSPADAAAAIRAEFESAYRRRFAFLTPQVGLVLEAVSVECIAESQPRGPELRAPVAQPYAPEARAAVRMYCLDERTAGVGATANLYLRESFAAGACVDGPAIIVERNATTVVEPGWRGRTTAAGNLELRRIRVRPAVRCRERATSIR